MSNLLPGIYYVRAYATSIIGTSYGTQIEFIIPFFPAGLVSETQYVPSLNNVDSLKVKSLSPRLELSSKFSKNAGDGISWNTFPNPTDGILHLSVKSLPNDVNCNLYVRDLFGRQVRLLKEVGNGIHIVDMSGLPPGIYLFTLKGSNNLNYGVEKVILR
jgi:hypothetical protein